MITIVEYILLTCVFGVAIVGLMIAIRHRKREKEHSRSDFAYLLGEYDTSTNTGACTPMKDNYYDNYNWCTSCCSGTCNGSGNECHTKCVDKCASEYQPISKIGCEPSPPRGSLFVDTQH